MNILDSKFEKLKKLNLSPYFGLSYFDGGKWGRRDFFNSDFSSNSKEYGKLKFAATEPIYNKLIDIASLSKTVYATITLNLHSKNLFDVNADLQNYFPFKAFKNIKIYHLLKHISGIRYKTAIKSRDQFTKLEFKKIFQLESEYEVVNFGKTKYSDINYILLGFVLKKHFQKDLSEILNEFNEEFGFQFISPNLADKNIKPYKDFLPVSKDYTKFKPHDPKAYILEGEYAHAGLFSSQKNLEKFVEYWLFNKFNFPQELWESSFGDLKNKEETTLNSKYKIPENYGYVWRQGRYNYKNQNHSGFTGPLIHLNPKSKTALIGVLTKVWDGDQTAFGCGYYEFNCGVWV